MNPARRAVALAGLLCVVAAAAACGGGGNSSPTETTSAAYDPATAALQAAGLEVCSESTRMVPAGLQTTVPEVALTRGFFVADDCAGSATSPNTMILFQFTSKDAIDAGAPKVKAAFPKGAFLQSGPLLIVATGPDAKANLAAVSKHVPKRVGSSTTG